VKKRSSTLARATREYAISIFRIPSTSGQPTMPTENGRGVHKAQVRRRPDVPLVVTSCSLTWNGDSHLHRKFDKCRNRGILSTRVL
jgi:hypothetical protein